MKISLLIVYMVGALFSLYVANDAADNESIGWAVLFNVLAGVFCVGAALTLILLK